MYIVEKLSRRGERLLTTKYGDHVLEYGPMHFDPKLQPCLAGLLKELSIETKTSPPYVCPVNVPNMNHLSLEEIKAIHKYSTLPAAFALLKFGFKRVLEGQWDVENDSIHDPFREQTA